MNRDKNKSEPMSSLDAIVWNIEPIEDVGLTYLEKMKHLISNDLFYRLSSKLIEIGVNIFPTVTLKQASDSTKLCEYGFQLSVSRKSNCQKAENDPNYLLLLNSTLNLIHFISDYNKVNNQSYENQVLSLNRVSKPTTFKGINFYDSKSLVTKNAFIQKPSQGARVLPDPDKNNSSQTFALTLSTNELKLSEGIVFLRKGIQFLNEDLDLNSNGLELNVYLSYINSDDCIVSFQIKTSPAHSFISSVDFESWIFENSRKEIMSLTNKKNDSISKKHSYQEWSHSTSTCFSSFKFDDRYNGYKEHSDEFLRKLFGHVWHKQNDFHEIPYHEVFFD